MLWQQRNKHTAIFTKILREIIALETEKYASVHTKIDAQMSLEKSNLGKLVQLQRVLIIKQQWNNLSTIWMPKTWQSCRENTGKNYLREITLSLSNPNTWLPLKSKSLTLPCATFASPLRILLHAQLETIANQVVLPSANYEIVSLALWKCFSASGTENQLHLSKIEFPFEAFALPLCCPLEKISTSLQSTQWIWKLFLWPHCLCPFLSLLPSLA